MPVCLFVVTLTYVHEFFPRFVAVTGMDGEFEKIDINQCPTSEGNTAGENLFAGTHRCRPTTMVRTTTGFYNLNNVLADHLKWRPMPDNMAGKLVTSNIASARTQWYSKDLVFWLAQMTLYIINGVTSITAFLSGIESHFKHSVDTLIMDTVKEGL